MIIIIATIKYGSTYYNTFTMGVCSILLLLFIIDWRAPTTKGHIGGSGT